MKYLLTLALVSTWAMGGYGVDSRDLGPTRCGEGPKPFSDITANFKYQTKVVDAVGGVSEFLYWDKKKEVVYRNRFNEVRGIRELGDVSKHSLITQSYQPIATLVNEDENKILTAEHGWMYDLQYKAWSQFYNGYGLQHLFWNREILYSVQAMPSYTHNTYTVYRYRPFSGNTMVACTFSGGEKKVKLANGHTFPKVFFYSTDKPTNGRENVNLHSLDVRTCRVDTMVYENVLAPVEEVFRFESVDGLLVKVDHPRENVLWANQTGCRYYDVDNLMPMVLDYEKPSFATWSESVGLKLYFLNSTQRAEIIPGLPIAELKTTDLRMSRDGERLYLAPRFEGEKSRWLLQVKMDSPIN